MCMIASFVGKIFVLRDSQNVCPSPLKYPLYDVRGQPPCHTHIHTVPLIVQNLPNVYIEKLLVFLAQRLDSSPHLQFYLTWCVELLTAHCSQLKESSASLMAPIRDLQKSITQKKADLGKM